MRGARGCVEGTLHFLFGREEMEANEGFSVQSVIERESRKRVR